MDLRLPYTFYPIALPHWIAWTLFLSAIVAGAGIGVVARVTRWSPRHSRILGCDDGRLDGHHVLRTRRLGLMPMWMRTAR
jgi:hypothetical protein